MLLKDFFIFSFFVLVFLLLFRLLLFSIVSFLVLVGFVFSQFSHVFILVTILFIYYQLLSLFWSLSRLQSVLFLCFFSKFRNLLLSSLLFSFTKNFFLLFQPILFLLLRIDFFPQSFFFITACICSYLLDSYIFFLYFF